MKNKHIHILLTIISGLAFIPFLGHVHLFDWDEINFAEAAREMIVSGDYLKVQIDFKMFWEKPPFFFWLQALSMKVFGVNEFAARFPNALIGILCINIFFYLGQKLKDQKFGLIWSVTYLVSFLPHFYFKTGIIDPWFNAFIFFGIYLLYQKRYLISGLLIGFAVLTKGPVGLLIYGMVWGIYYLLNFKKQQFPVNEILYSLIGLILIPGLWFLYDFLINGPQFIIDFITYQIRLLNTQDAGHGGPFIYHWIVILLGCFPMSLFIFDQIKWKGLHKEENGEWLQLNWIMFLSVLILFSIVKTKIVHYSSFCYLPLSYLVATGIYNKQVNIGRWITLFIGSIFGICIALLPVLLSYPEFTTQFINDKWALEKFNGNAIWYPYEAIWGLLLIIACIGSFILLKKQYWKTLTALATTSLVVVMITMHSFAPRIEAISQRAYINMLKEVDTEKNYIDVIGFKSYAHLFYSNKQKPTGKITTIPFEKRRQWLLNGDIDKDAIIFLPSVKLKHYLKHHSELVPLETKNGWTKAIRKVKP